MPERADVLKMMRALVDGSRGRAEVADWARPWIFDDSFPEVHDEPVRDALDQLVAADSQVDAGIYLFSREDFRKWRHDFEQEF